MLIWFLNLLKEISLSKQATGFSVVHFKLDLLFTHAAFVDKRQMSPSDDHAE